MQMYWKCKKPGFIFTITVKASTCSMRILLVAATEAEMRPVRESCSLLSESPHELDYLITGVGVMAATYALSRSLASRKPDLVIALGIAGAFPGGPAPAEVVRVDADVLADLGAGEDQHFRSVTELGLSGANDFPYSEGMLFTVATPQLAGLQHVGSVRGLTVNHIRTDAEFLKLISAKYSAQIETMEGAAIHYVCLQEQVPLLHLRAISNMAGERDKTKWVIPEALHHLGETICHLMHELNAETTFPADTNRNV